MRYLSAVRALSPARFLRGDALHVHPVPMMGLLACLMGLPALLLVREEAPPPERKVIGYLFTPKGDPAPFESVRRNSKTITHLCPTWWEMVDGEGNIEAKSDPAVLELARQEGIAVLPLLANKGFDKALIHNILVSPQRRAWVIDQIETLLKAGGYEGINIDFEAVPFKDRKYLTAFMRELYARLQPQGLLVTIDVPAKEKDNPKAAWSGAFDYVELAKACDHFMVMAYDEHWSTGSPGPVASTAMVRRVMKYAASAVPREKLIMGVPFYGYDWPPKGRAKGMTHTKSIALARAKKAPIRWDKKAPSAWYRYLDGQGKPRTVWFETRRSLEARLTVAQEMEIPGISIWRLGDEDASFWEPIATFRSGRTLIAETVPAGKNGSLP
ncbi:MAG: hypothetical protein IT210_23625 [Armatimonadetes bacterium]|nr:hypothetical protein [Armatimonadota bacterium]